MLNISTEKEAKNEDYAIELALYELKEKRENVNVEILQKSKKGFLGLYNKNARVRVSLKVEIIQKRQKDEKQNELKKNCEEFTRVIMEEKNNKKIDYSIKSNSKNEKEINSYKKAIKEIKLYKNGYFSEFLSQIAGFNLEKEVMFLYKEDNTNDFIMSRYIAKFALKDKEIENLFSEDNIPCFVTIFNKEQKDLISIMYKSTNRTKSSILFGEEIRNIYYCMKDQEDKKKGIDSCKGAVWRKRETEINVIIKKMMQESVFNDENELYLFLKNLIDPFLFAVINVSGEFYKKFSSMNSVRYSDITKNIFDEMKKDGIVSTRWKSEFELYVLIQSYYFDAIFQYKTDWLGTQSIDIFIPSLNVGVEYQGKQHYEKVELFGGEKGFEETRKRDEQKKIKCKQNEVILLEWPYTDDISDINLNILMQTNEIILPEKNKRNINKNGNEYLNLEEKKVNPNIKNVDEIINQKDLEGIYSVFIELIKKKEYEKIAVIWEKIIENNTYRSFEKKHFLMDIYNREIYIEEFYKIVINSHKLKRFYLEMDSLNYYSRKLLIFLAEEVDFKEAVSCLAKVVKNNKEGDWGTLKDYERALNSASSNGDLVIKLIAACGERLN